MKYDIYLNDLFLFFFIDIFQLNNFSIKSRFNSKVGENRTF